MPASGMAAAMYTNRATAGWSTAAAEMIAPPSELPTRTHGLSVLVPARGGRVHSEGTAAKRTIAFDRSGAIRAAQEVTVAQSAHSHARCDASSRRPAPLTVCDCSTATQHRLQQNIAEFVCLDTCRRRCGAVALELTAARPRPGRRRADAVQKIARTRSKKMQKMLGILRVIGYRNGGSTSTTRRLAARESVDKAEGEGTDDP
jgi:hypothetical protein